LEDQSRDHFFPTISAVFLLFEWSDVVVIKRAIDWHERDKQILKKVKDAVRSLLNADKPARITLSRIGKTIGLLALLEKHLDLMPLTKAYLKSVAESVEDFQIRRIKWAIKLLDECGEEIQRWKVIRVAGLRENVSERVKAVLESEL
jgi:hypothetical protein